MKRVFIVFCIIFAVFSSSVFAQDNPFFSGEKKEREAAPQQQTEYPGIIQGVLGAIGGIQRDLNSTLTSLSRELIEENNPVLLFVLIGLSIFYGIIHALGPGHGKIIMISYALSNPLKARQGVLLGVFIAVVHAVSAVVLVSVIYFVLNAAFSVDSRNSLYIMSLVSYALIAAFGFFLIVRVFWSKICRRKVPGEIAFEAQEYKNTNLLFPALIIGLVPCEGTIFIMVFFISINAFFLGVLLSSAMAFGMAVTISIMGLIAIYSKKGGMRLLESRKGLYKTILVVIQLIGSTVIFLFGVLLFFSKL